MQIIMAMCDTGYDVSTIDALHQIAHACTCIVNNHHIVDVVDQETYRQAVSLGIQCLTMGMMRLHRNYARTLAVENQETIDSCVDLRVLKSQNCVNAELKVHKDIVHPFSRA